MLTFILNYYTIYLGDLKMNKTAIITGAGRAVLSDGSCGSIGYGIATAYAKEGANLVITGRNTEKLNAAKEELERLKAKYGDNEGEAYKRRIDFRSAMKAQKDKKIGIE